MLRWIRLYKFARALMAGIDTRKEQDAVATYVADHLNAEGKLGVTEWAAVGRMLGILGKR